MFSSTHTGELQFSGRLIAGACVTRVLYLSLRELKGQRLQSGLGLNVAFLNGSESVPNQL